MQRGEPRAFLLVMKPKNIKDKFLPLGNLFLSKEGTGCVIHNNAIAETKLVF